MKKIRPRMITTTKSIIFGKRRNAPNTEKNKTTISTKKTRCQKKCYKKCYGNQTRKKYFKSSEENDIKNSDTLFSSLVKKMFGI